MVVAVINIKMQATEAVDLVEHILPQTSSKI